MPFSATPFKSRYHRIHHLKDNHNNHTISRRIEPIVYIFGEVLILIYAITSLVEPFIPIKCDIKDTDVKYGNPDYSLNNCDFKREVYLLGMCRMEAMLTRRMLLACAAGAVIGWERRAHDRAGIRTMSLVSMGACLFTISSAFGFMDGPMNWDASRVAAAIPSGVGFLGAGLIWKSTFGEGESTVHQVHGLTTSASVWLSASVGVAAGGGLYFIVALSVVMIVMVLKYGPTPFLHPEEDDDTYKNSDSRSSSFGDDDGAFIDHIGGDSEPCDSHIGSYQRDRPHSIQHSLGKE